MSAERKGSGHDGDSDRTAGGAAVTRINQLTERIFTAARNVGGGLADAHERALRSLADDPADPKQSLEWVEAR